MVALLEERVESRRIFHEMNEWIPGGVNSPARALPGLEQVPLIVDRAKGDLIWDVDAREYIDYCQSWGALIHGHAKKEILDAVKLRMDKGTSFGISTPIEGVLAKELVERIDSVDKVRFVSSGTEATMSAVRLARAYTDREIVVKFSGNYHGHADVFLIDAGSGVATLNGTSSSKGVPDDLVKHTVSLRYNDVDACLDFLSKLEYASRVAAVILEPVAGNMGCVPASLEFLTTLREETSRIGALLIFDEVITGFRVSPKGMQGIFGIQPDLSTFGKIIGAGFPAAAFGGRREIMAALAPDGPVYQAGTLSGNPVAMEAGYQALSLLSEEGFYLDLEDKTNLLTRPLREEFARRNIEACVQQVGSMFTIFWGKREVNNFDDAKALDLLRFKHFFGYLLERGIYMSPSQFETSFISSAHTREHLEKTRDVILTYVRSL